VEYFNDYGSIIRNDARCTHKIKSGIAMTREAFNRNKTLFTGKMDLNLKMKLVKCCIWSIALCGAETWTLWKVDQKYVESSEMWCWRRTDKISWTDRVRNEEVLHKVKEERNIVCIRERKHTNCNGHTLRRNCILKHIIDDKIKGEIYVTRKQ
jgi:hypothetical protein